MKVAACTSLLALRICFPPGYPTPVLHLFNLSTYHLQTSLPSGPCHLVIHLLKNQESFPRPLKNRSKPLILEFKAFQNQTLGLHSYLITCCWSPGALLLLKLPSP